VLEGDQGLWAALTNRPADPHRTTRGLGERWETERITVKPYPACQLLHAALDATAAAVRGQAVEPGGVAEVAVTVHPDGASVVCEPAAVKLAPRTPYDAKFSLPWSVAALLVDADVTVATYAPESLGRRDVLDLARRVRPLTTDGAGLAADAPARAVVRLHDGRELSAEVPRSRGGPEAPLDEADLLRKVAGLTGSEASGRRLRDAVRGLEVAPDLTQLVSAFAQAAGGER
jgi:2-methylcitrate dehydratase PrpD